MKAARPHFTSSTKRSKPSANFFETIEAAKFVPDEELAKPDDPEAGPLQMFTRFFGFRKRGSGHTLSSVAL